jgi:hypothetical protein
LANSEPAAAWRSNQRIRLSVFLVWQSFAFSFEMYFLTALLSYFAPL